MHFHAKVLGIALLGLLAAGCTTTFQAAAVDPTTGRYAIDNVVPPSAIKVSRPFQVDSATRIVFVRSNLSTVESYDTYFEDSIENIGFFGEVLRKDEFERMLVRDGHADEVPTVDGFAGLSRAAQVYGPFLVVDFEVEAAAGYQVDVVMSVFDAATAEELLRVEHGVTNWAGLDDTLFQPTLNVLSNWLDENSDTFPNPPAVAAAAAPESVEEAGGATPTEPLAAPTQPTDAATQ